MALTGIISSEVASQQISTATAAISTPAAVDASVVSNAGSASNAVSPSEKNYAVDTVTLQNVKQDKKQETVSEKPKIEENKQAKAAIKAFNSVLFDYNAKGDLRIKFMDSSNNVIYQTPPVLFARMTDLMAKAQTTVNTKV